MLAERFRVEWHLDLGTEPAHKRLLLRLAEEAKIRLSTETDTPVVLTRSLGQGSRCAVTVTRDAFEQATADITERMAAPACQVLTDAGYDPLDLDRVVLVGGMTRMPAVRRLVKQITGLDPYGHIDPDRVVALGAAVQAGVLAGEVRNITLVDVTPLSLGIETQGGLFARLIKRNTSIPVAAGRLFTNAQDGQTEMDIHVLQGERELADDNMTLGRFQLAGISPQPRGQAKVEVTFDIDANGMVQVSAVDLQTEGSGRIRIEAADRPSREDADRILTESCKYVESDSRKRQGIEARIRAENLIRAARQLIEETGQSPHEGLRQAIQVVEEGTSKVQSALADEKLEGLEESTKALETSLKKLSLEIKTNAATVGLQGQAA
jgi:molecular chaperone DnaK